MDDLNDPYTDDTSVVDNEDGIKHTPKTPNAANGKGRSISKTSSNNDNSDVDSRKPSRIASVSENLDVKEVRSKVPSAYELMISTAEGKPWRISAFANCRIPKLC